MTEPVAEALATEDDVVAAYRLLLGREPDPGGLEHHRELVGAGIRLDRLVETFTSSDEYLARHAPKSANVVSVPLDGYVVYGEADDPDLSRIAADGPSRQPHIIRLLTEYLKAGDVVADVGAHVGIASFAAARIAGPTGKVIAFEPDDRNARHFLQGVKRNGWELTVRLFRFALSDGPRIVGIEGRSDAHPGETAASGRLVQSIAGDEILETQDRINFLKITIDGHEPSALAGLRNTLRKHRPYVLCAFNPRRLRDRVGLPADQFADDLFQITKMITVIEHDGTKSVVDSGRALMTKWRKANTVAAASGLLPDGMVRFDLLFRALGA